MKWNIAALLALGLVCAQPAAALTTRFAFGGLVEGSEYGAAAAADIYTVAPIGSAYTLTFSYDAATAPTYGGPAYGSYANVAVNAVLTIGGTVFSIPTANIATGGGPFDGGVRFTLYNNVPFSPSRIAGYQLIDFSFTLSDPSGTALPTGALPSTFELSRFAVRSLTPRFVFGANGETRLRLSVDVPAATAVPEPASWAMLLVGFGAVGMGLRRKTPALRSRAMAHCGRH